jgi:hypothetical protein
VARSTERGEAAGDHRGFVDRRAGVLVEPPAKPARGCPPAADARILLRDQRGELQGLAQVDAADLARGGLGDEEVATLERSAEDGARVPLGRDLAAPSRGRAVPRAYGIDPPVRG